ncbi:cytochrome-c peroxidase [Rubrivirga sp.]|uniref:cytochrome-c peroxidase n=1 Tax=Rubrivirga sp. TaxID=1885344 RepID=UPI003C710555
MLTAQPSWFRPAALAVFSVVAIGATFAVQLGDTPVLPATPYDYDGIALPGHLQHSSVLRWDNTPDDNPITDAGATLGRVLFYDVRLSRNATVSCASCHRQEHGFSDPRPLSVGFEGEHTDRNSMALAFARYDRTRRFFWDRRAPTLEALTLEPIQDPIEMGMTLDDLTARLEATTFYPALFADAFGTPDVTSDRVARALSQFVRSIVASNSRYDAAREAQEELFGRPLAGLTDQENRGLELFFGPGRCEQCHSGDMFTGRAGTNNGLDSTFADPGTSRRVPGIFKTVSLRNIELTAPYMHDGRFETLEEVVDHYSTGVQISPSLASRLRRGGVPIRPSFSDDERADLVAFLRTLTDTTITTDPKWSDPFPPQ